MRHLAEGAHEFRTSVFRDQHELFERLVSGQNPSALFICCSDSRVDPTLMTQAGPGELFVLRNAGNLIPPFGASNGGESATVEFAVAKLKVSDIIVCGHTQCGAVHGLCHPDTLDSLPVVRDWLKHAAATRRIIEENYADYEGPDLLSIATQENVLMQIENLQTHPSIAARLHRGDITLHGWVYKLETGQVFSFSPDKGRFVPIEECIAIRAA